MITKGCKNTIRLIGETVAIEHLCRLLIAILARIFVFGRYRSYIVSALEEGDEMAFATVLWKDAPAIGEVVIVGDFGTN